MRNPNDPEDNTDYPDPNEPQNPDPTPDNDEFAEQLQALYQQYYHRDATNEEVESHRGNPNGIAGVAQMFRDLFPDATPETPAAPAAPAPPAPSGGGSLGGGAPSVGSPGSLISPFPGTFMPSPGYSAPAAPVFQGPEWQAPAPIQLPEWVQPEAFHAPTGLDQQNDPGFQERMKLGLGALASAAGAKGMTRSGAQLKGLNDYAQNFASAEYGNVWNRAADQYKQNYQTQYVDPYMAKYKGAVDKYETDYRTQYADPYAAKFANAVQGYQGQLHGYDTQTAADQRQSELNAQTNWNKFRFDYDAWHAQQWEEFQKRFQVASA